MAGTEQNNEKELVFSAQKGDREAFDALVRSCAEMIYNLSLRLLGKPEDAEDLAQTAFVNAFRNISKFKMDSSFSTWMYRITVNLWKNKLRANKRRRFFEISSVNKTIDTFDGEINFELSDEGPDILKEKERAEKINKIRKLLDELDEKTREMIVLRDIEGKSYEEIGEILGCALGTVKSRLARARESLKNEYLTIFRDEENEL